MAGHLSRFPIALLPDPPIRDLPDSAVQFARDLALFELIADGFNIHTKGFCHLRCAVQKFACHRLTSHRDAPQKYVRHLDARRQHRPARKKHLGDQGAFGRRKDGKRIRRFYSFKGSATAARERLADLAKASRLGSLRDENALFGTVLDAWEGSLNVGRKSTERYRELVALHIRPHLGALKIGTIRPSRLDSLYGDLKDGRRANGSVGARPLAPRTIEYVHRLMVQVFALAERDGLIPLNPAKMAKRPKVERGEVEILNADQVKDVLQKLHNHKRMYRLAMLGLGTGLRRGELCALRWRDMELDAATLRVEQSLEQTRPQAGKGGPQLRFKEPKAKTSRRTIAHSGFCGAGAAGASTGAKRRTVADGLGQGTRGRARVP